MVNKASPTISENESSTSRNRKALGSEICPNENKMLNENQHRRDDCTEGKSFEISDVLGNLKRVTSVSVEKNVFAVFIPMQNKDHLPAESLSGSVSAPAGSAAELSRGRPSPPAPVAGDRDTD